MAKKLEKQQRRLSNSWYFEELDENLECELTEDAVVLCPSMSEPKDSEHWPTELIKRPNANAAFWWIAE